MYVCMYISTVSIEKKHHIEHDIASKAGPKNRNSPSLEVTYFLML